MKIRKATTEDSKEIADYFMLAMEDIFYNFIGESSPEKAWQILEELIREKGNQYSFKNTWVIESEEEVIGAANVDDGAKLHKLRKPVADKIESMFNRDFNPEDEIQSGEFYIDCVGVNPTQQGKGFGSKIFEFLIDEYVHKRNKTLGLLVEKENPSAKKLYLRLGFEVVGKKSLVGKELEHLQFRYKN